MYEHVCIYTYMSIYVYIHIYILYAWVHICAQSDTLCANEQTDSLINPQIHVVSPCHMCLSDHLILSIKSDGHPCNVAHNTIT